MTLSERLEQVWGSRVCTICGSPSHAFCNKRLPEWRRRALADQAKRGNVATKELVA
jgi:hypothetical protein